MIQYIEIDVDLHHPKICSVRRKKEEEKIKLLPLSMNMRMGICLFGGGPRWGTAFWQLCPNRPESVHENASCARSRSVVVVGWRGGGCMGEGVIALLPENKRQSSLNIFSMVIGDI